MQFGMPGRCLREVIGAVNYLKNFSLGRVSIDESWEYIACDRIEIKLIEQLPCTLVLSDGFHKKVLAPK